MLLLGLLAYNRDPENNGPPTATDTTLMWLAGIRDNHPRMLGTFMAYPFSFREGWAQKRCTQVVTNVDDVAPWLQCTHDKDPRFIEALRSARSDLGRIHMTMGLAKAGKRLRSLAQGSRASSFVSGSVRGDGVTYEFVFAVSGTDAKGRRLNGFYVDSSSEK